MAPRHQNDAFGTVPTANDFEENRVLETEMVEDGGTAADLLRKPAMGEVMVEDYVSPYDTDINAMSADEYGLPEIDVTF